MCAFVCVCERGGGGLACSEIGQSLRKEHARALENMFYRLVLTADFSYESCWWSFEYIMYSIHHVFMYLVGGHSNSTERARQKARQKRDKNTHLLRELMVFQRPPTYSKDHQHIPKTTNVFQRPPTRFSLGSSSNKDMSSLTRWVICTRTENKGAKCSLII